jgi:hypothetical protein
MQFYSDGQTFKVAYITGPTHNFLGLAFQSEFNDSVSIESLTVNSGEPVRLSIDDVQKAVMEGIDEANNDLGVNYCPSRIQFVASDSPPAGIYRMLAKRIIYRLYTQPDSYNGTTD